LLYFTMCTSICLNCGKETPNPKFCSRSCAATINNKMSPKRQPQGKCVYCSKKIKTSNLYCSEECLNLKRIERKEERRVKLKEKLSFRKRRKLLAIELKGGECYCCGYKTCPTALEFHHLDRGTKDFGIASKSSSLEALKKELEKCILVCANCHREIHAGFRDINL